MMLDLLKDIRTHIRVKLYFLRLAYEQRVNNRPST